MSTLARLLLLGVALSLCGCGVKGKLKSPGQIALENQKAEARQAREEKDAAEAAAEKTDMDANNPAESARETLVGPPSAPASPQAEPVHKQMQQDEQSQQQQPSMRLPHQPNAPTGDGVAPPPVGTPGTLDQAPSK